PASPVDESRFLSVITRTQGRRIGLLSETLDRLAQQSDRDFEVLVVRHGTDHAQGRQVDGVIAALPSWMQERVRVLDVERPGRSAPLNAGFEAARGRYASILDDDDLALPEWVATFHDLEAAHPGQVLRSVAVRQPVRAEIGPDGPAAVPVAPADRLWPTTFHFVDHLLVNHTPPVALAYPLTVFRDLGERFDESLDTTEDWDFLMRAASLVGVASSPIETCTYRWWVEAEGSRAEHTEAEWVSNEEVVRAKLDALGMRLPPGSVARLRQLVTERDDKIATLEAERDREAANAQQLLGEAQAYLARLNEAEERIREQRGRIQKLRARLAD
ncbi:MAG: hypothetical protein JWN68_997, partial [Nocardioides sp.]|uniref:glycosyltransferase family A protein n=1 Tax=Nocardioides sp. TaxID=35761 RepID=UPI0026323D21